MTLDPKTEGCLLAVTLSSYALVSSLTTAHAARLYVSAPVQYLESSDPHIHSGFIFITQEGRQWVWDTLVKKWEPGV